MATYIKKSINKTKLRRDKTCLLPPAPHPPNKKEEDLYRFMKHKSGW